MSKGPIADNFYLGISIHRTLRRSPSSVLALHEDLLLRNELPANSSNVGLALAASRELFAFLSLEGGPELRSYEASQRAAGRPIRGPVVIQFDLVFQILAQIIEYAKQHPKDSIEIAASAAVLEDYLEKKLGKIAGSIWRKMYGRKTSPYREIIALVEIERTTKATRRSKKGPTRKCRSSRRNSAPSSNSK